MISQLCPSAGSQARISDVHHLSCRVSMKRSACSEIGRVRSSLHAGVWKEVLMGDQVLRGPEASDLSTAQRPLGDHLLRGQGLRPVPRPPPLPFTHLWPAVPVPASLGIESQTELPRDGNGEGISRAEISDVSTAVSLGDDC